MGKLRTEPKVKPFLDGAEYSNYLGILQEAQNAAVDHHIYYDLDPKEKPSKVRKALLFVAEKEGISLGVRNKRGSDSLVLSFKDGGKPAPSRLSADESRQRILRALNSSKKAMQKSEIIAETGISPSTWNIRIKELIQDRKVVRSGDRRDTKYKLK